MNNIENANEIGVSVLGTKSHWDDLYKCELSNFDDHGDEGEIWFGKAVSKKIVDYLNTLESEIKHKSVIDLGCGNGMLLHSLWDNGFKKLLGVDYSENGIRLAETVAAAKNCNASFKVANIVEPLELGEKFALVLDKGTYDAISIDPDNALRKRQAYIENVFAILENSGLFIITTCNWTEAEIISQFSEKLTFKETLPSPKFTFGGKAGNTVTTVVFQK